MQFEPGADLVVEDEIGVQVAAETEGHHEQPGLAQDPASGVVPLAGIAEVDLGHLAGRRLHGDGDVGVRRAMVPVQLAAQDTKYLTKPSKKQEGRNERPNHF